jgi:hypothetical protein
MAVAIKTTLQGDRPNNTSIILSIWEGDYAECVYLINLTGELCGIILSNYELGIKIRIWILNLES